MFIEIDRWVKDYANGGKIYIVKQTAIVIEPLVERVRSCDNCQAEKELGADACLGCAG